MYERIKKLADELTQSDTIFDRADLTSELHEFGVLSDSLEVSDLVWGAYGYYNRNSNIREAFMNNARDAYLVDECEILHLLEESDGRALFQYLRNRLEKGGRSLNFFNITDMSGDSTISVPTRLISSVMGTKGFQDVREEAKLIFDGYTKMVDTYEIARMDVKAVASDFVMLRGKILETYRQYALALIDVFGDSVRMISPELFEYDAIEWPDVQGMIKDLHLEYEQVSNSCSLLISEISDSFSELAKKSITAFRNPDRTQLILSGLTLFNHHLSADEKTSALQTDLLKLKNYVQRDATMINGDIGRLFVIFRTLSDLYIPKSKVFYTYGAQVLDRELKELLDSIYSTDDLKELKRERDKAVNECKLLEQQMVDHQFNIDYYTLRISEANALIKSLKPSYSLALESRPRSPFVLFNVLTFNILKKKYNRSFYKWNLQYGGLLREYNDFQREVELDRDALLKTRLHLQEKMKKHNMLLQEVNGITEDMYRVIRVDDALKLKVSKHLPSLVQLLRVSREIVESKLDKKLTKAISFDHESLELPSELKESVSRFIASLEEKILLDTLTIEDMKVLSDEQLEIVGNDLLYTG